MSEPDFRAIFNQPPPEPSVAETLLRRNLQEKSAELKTLWEKVNGEWGYEDPVYRFYAQSFKVYAVQELTLEIVACLESLVPERKFHPFFQKILKEGTGREFSMADNRRWVEAAAPTIEAFQHARFFLDMACRYTPPPPAETAMDSGWAALRSLYEIW